jgi:diaminopimelate epimerase
MSGSGNDFVMIDVREKQLVLVDISLSEFIAKICRRGLSVGADGVILVDYSLKADYAWHYYNADGGEVAMCGNGSRCVARFAYLNHIAPAQHTIETLAGIIHAEVLGKHRDRVRVQLTNPTDFRLNLSVSGIPTEGHFVNTGVPHVVYFVDDVEKVDIIQQGKATRYHSLFSPAGTNANFVQIIHPHQIKIRTYERGVEDETLACGTGAVAAAVISAVLGKLASPVEVVTHCGITLGVDFKQNALSFSEIHLEGDARIIYKGELSEESLL